MAPPAVTPSGVRDGDPAALAGLCDVRGPAVLAYCRNVAGDAAAPAAAAEAFAAFRAAVYAAEDPLAINPEALLVNATRQAAARHATIVAPGFCAAVPRLLAARAGRSISLADLDRLEAHLETCWACRAPVARYKAAERAYRDPPETPVAPEAAAAIVAALAAAAPLRADEPPPPPPPPPLAPEPAPLNGVGVDTPTTEFRPLADLDVAPPAPQPSEPEPEPEDEPARWPAAMTQRARRPRGATAGLGTATHLPRPQRGSASPRRPRGAGRPAIGPGPMRPSVVLPIVLVAIALVVALFVSGVFGADDPTPTSGSSIVPSSVTPPAATRTPEIVVVPGAGDASAAAVERAKSRARAASKGKSKRKPAAATPVAATAPPPPPAAAPTASAPPKPASAPKSSSGGTGGKAGIDANNGATGAEQLPPAADTSTVPDLTPPPDPVLDPPG